MSEPDGHPVHADQAILATLQEQVHTVDTSTLTARALSLGVRPPDSRPGWFVVLEYADDGDERGLFWVGPDDE